jgi:hypothetical protein
VPIPARVARFFLVQHTKTRGNIPNDHKNIPNGFTYNIYNILTFSIPLEGVPNDSHFCDAIMPSGNPDPGAEKWANFRTFFPGKIPGKIPRKIFPHKMLEKMDFSAENVSKNPFSDKFHGIFRGK